MKHSLVAAMAAFTTLITACANDNSSGVSDTEEPISFSTPGTYTVNKKKQLIIMTDDVSNQNVCNFEDGKYTWEPSKKAAKPDTFKYEFFGDTLVLFKIVNEETSDYGTMYVGGKAGKLEGTWVDSNCEYTAYSKETECFDDNYEEKSLELSDGKFIRKVAHYFDNYIKDIEKTSFVDNLINQVYKSLVGWYPDVYLPSIFSSYGNDEAKATIKKYGIKVLESTDSSQTFTLRKKTYTFKVNQAEQSLSSMNHILMEINVEVSDGETTCVGEVHIREVGKEQCNAKYEDDYMIDYDFANGGIELKDRTHYAFGDNGKFEECLYEIAENLPERDSDYGNLKDSEK